MVFAPSSTPAPSTPDVRRAIIARKPSTKSGTSGGRFSPGTAAPRRRREMLIPATNGASRITRDSLTTTAVAIAPGTVAAVATT